MKWFVLHPGGNRHGVLFDDEATTRSAVFYTPGQAKFEASYKTVREGARK